jgi:CO/xanthine dehydrogenase Mo-binding subunit
MNNLSPMQDIGRRSTRFDALDKIAGKEKFASDVYPENMLWTGAYRPRVAHGMINSVKIECARAIDGVIAVLTRKDIKGDNRQGFVYWDMR